MSLREHSFANLTAFSAGRYVVRGILGEGGQKVVYLVHDQVLDRQCALSVLKSSSLDSNLVQRFKSEAQAMARLQGTSSVVSVYDYGDEDGAPYLVSEYVPGPDLRREIRDSPNGLELERVIDIASDIGRALAAAHARAIIHRDVTPANVWITEDGRAKLGDFGLALGEGSAMNSAGAVVGTPNYMAPEQALGERCDTKSDLYSLGVVMYEMATGRRPFAGDDPLAVIGQHISATAVAPSWHNPAIPPALESLILKLMAKTPDERPRDSAAVVEALIQIRSVPSDHESTPAGNPLERLAGGVFVGRDAELKELRTIVEAAMTGRPQLVLLGGEPGIGKTRLIDQVSTYAKLRGAQVRWGRCGESDGAPAFWPWIQVLRTHAESLDDESLRAEVADDGPLIGRLVPDVAKRVEVEAAAASEDQGARFRLFDAIDAWLRRSSRSTPLVVVLDDLHWADESSVQLLRHVVESRREDRLLIIGSFRDDETDRAHPLGALLADVPRLRGARLMSIARLDEEAVRTYVELTTGKEAAGALARAVFRQTDGNPLFVTEVVRLLTASGRIDERDTSWTQEIPEGVRGVISRRLGVLSSACRSVLTLASVIGREFELRVLERIAVMPLSELLDALDEALAARLIVSETPRQNSRYAFSHALVRETLYVGLRTAERLSTHARTAEALEVLYGADAGPRVSLLAHHFREASTLGDIEKSITYSVQAGDAARRVFGYEEALVHWRAAISLMDDTAHLRDKASLLQRASDLMYISGVNYDVGVEFLERALTLWEQLGDTRRQAAAHGRLGRMFTAHVANSDIVRAMRHLRAAVELQPDEEPSTGLAVIYSSLASAQERRLEVDDALQSARRARAIAKQIGHEQLIAVTMHQEGDFLWKKGRTREGIALLESASKLANQINDPIAGFYCSWVKGFREMHYRGNPRDAITTYREELEHSRMANFPIQRERMNIELADALLLCGDRAGMYSCEANAEDRAVWQSEFDGKWDELVRSYIEAARHFARVGNRLVEGMRWESAGQAKAHLGQLDHAAEFLAMATETYAGKDIGAEMCARTRLWTVEALRGRQEEAQRHEARCTEILDAGEEWLGQMGRIEAARAATLAGRGKLEAADRAFTRAVEILSAFELVWDEAETLRIWGRVRADAGDRLGAREQFQRAIELYRRIAAGAPWITRIVREYTNVPADVGDQTWGA